MSSTRTEAAADTGSGSRWLSRLGAGVAVGGLGLTLWLLVRSDAMRELQRLPWSIVLVVPLVGVPIVLGTLSWERAFPRGSRPAPFRTLFGVRLAGEAINNALFSSYVGGEPVKALLVARRGTDTAGAMASALIGKTTFILGEILFLLAAVGVAAALFGRQAPLVTKMFTIASGGLALGVLAVLIQRRRVVGRGARVLRALRVGPAALWRTAMPAADAIDDAVRRYYREQRVDFAASIAWAALGWLLGAVELLVFLHLMTDVEHPVMLAVVIEAGVLVAKGLSFFVPGSIGVQEGGISWLFETTGLGLELGLAYAVVRRLREVFWIALGFAMLWWYTRAPSEAAARRATQAVGTPGAADPPQASERER